MTAHIRMPRRAWLLALAVLILLSAHLLVPYFMSHTAKTLVSGLVVLMVLKHLGLLALAFRTLHGRNTRSSSQQTQ